MNLTKDCKITVVEAAAAAGTTDLTTDVLDMSGFDGVMFIALTGDVNRTLFSPRRFIGPATGFNHLRPAGTAMTWGGQTITLERGR